ncbi:Proline and serine-rich protein [Actinidia chinensis var. chinensis]|uniref:Proline and serine-rich protein n=1 Tax=Actinidia chinensis var. chinensis TaxID=1590841 RepID=A0A2R6PLJ5_ACTCC|nr:Proline and serine-rich protein [Actinidia chinensis var. chinensis]
MNRSFRAQESQMQASSMRQRQQIGSIRTSMMKEKEEELSLFLEMRKREKERNDLLLQNSEEFDAPLGLQPGTSPIFNITSSTPARKTGADDFLNSENDKNDYDWLLTPPGTPLFPSLEMESQRTVMSQIGNPKARPIALKSRLANPQPEPARSNLALRQSPSSPGLNNSSAGIRRPSSSGGPGSRPATPTGRPTLAPATKPTLTTAPKSTLTTSSKPVSTAAPRTSRSSTPTSRTTLTSSRPTVPARSTTPLSRTTTRSSTPTSRPTLPATKSTSRAPTPTRRPTTHSTVTNTSAPPVKSPSSSSVTKSGPTIARNPVPPRASSPTVKPRPWKPSEMPGFSLDAPPNLRTSLPDRPLSATRGRPGAPSARSSSVEPVSNGRVRRQSCSPSRGRPPNGVIYGSGSSVPAASRLHAKANDNVSPILIGTKMVERVINMRKLVPPKQDDKHSPHSNLSGKSSSPDSLGFGRTLSKKSLDMAIRHMDIRRTIPGNLRPLMTNVPASSMYSVRSGPTRSRTISVSDSPLATSSNASSEVSVNNNGLCIDGIEMDDDINSNKGVRSPASLRGR